MKTEQTVQLLPNLEDLYPVSKKELKKTSEVLANAFSKDPIFEEMQISGELIIKMYEMIIRVSLRYGNESNDEELNHYNKEKIKRIFLGAVVSLFSHMICRSRYKSGFFASFGISS